MDVALVAVRAERLPEVLRDYADVGVGASLILSSGFGEEGPGQGPDLAEEIRGLASATPMRVVGPNCARTAATNLSMFRLPALRFFCEGNLAVVGIERALRLVPGDGEALLGGVPLGGLSNPRRRMPGVHCD